MSEHDEQVAVIEWAEQLEYQQPLLKWLYAIPNGTRTTPRIAARMKAEGVKKGVPDLCLPVPNQGFHGLYIEMKAINLETGRKGSIKPEQKEWYLGLRELGYATAICYTADEAIDLICEYLEGL